MFHVAVTRAKEELYLAVPQTRRSHSQGFVLMKPSRFLTELSDELTEPMELEQGLPELIAGEPDPTVKSGTSLPSVTPTAD